MPVFANAIADTGSAINDDDARALRAALATAPGPSPAQPRGAWEMREAARRLKAQALSQDEAHLEAKAAHRPAQSLSFHFCRMPE